MNEVATITQNLERAEQLGLRYDAAQALVAMATPADRWEAQQRADRAFRAYRQAVNLATTCPDCKATSR